MLVGEAPGENEDATGRPFVGAAGKKLEWMLGMAGLRREDLYITNVVKCWPGEGNRTPTAKEIAQCQRYLQTELETVQPQLVICMGATAMRGLGLTGTVTKAHGRPIATAVGNWSGVVVPMYHPAAYLHNPNLKAEIVTDWTSLTTRLSTTPTEKFYRRGFVNDLPKLLDQARASGAVAFDLETEGAEARKNPAIGVRIVGFSLSLAPHTAWYFVGTRALSRLAPLLEDPSVAKLCHNTKYEYMVLRQYGITLQNYHDTKIMAHLLGYTQTGLKALSYSVLGEVATEYDAVEWHDAHQVVAYGCGDADHTLQIYTRLRGALDEAGLLSLYETVELPLVRVLGDMELAGIPVSTDQLTAFGQELAARRAILADELTSLAGKPINLNSPKQLASYLYDPTNLALAVHRRSKKTKAASTGKAALEKHLEVPFVAKLLEFRQVDKFLNTYVEGLLFQQRGGIIHPQWKQVGDNLEDTAGDDWAPITGRLSSSTPNFQNIPKRDDLSKPLRHAIIAPKGLVWLSFDYAQLELRVLAEYLARTGDKSFSMVFAEGRDPHAETAALLHRSRDDGKTANFAVVYGAQLRKLMEAFPGVSEDEARELRATIFAAHPGLPVYMAEQVAKAKATGAVYTLYGRRRLIPKVWSRDRALQAEAEREIVNTPIQGTAADIVKIAMLRLSQTVWGTYQRAQIHDDIKLLVPAPLVEAAKVEIPPLLTEGYLVSNLVVEATEGGTW